MKISTSKIQDIEEIFRLYKTATEFQKVKFPGNQWPIFDRHLIETEIKEQRQFKLLIDDQIACIWAITFSDQEIWEEKNNDPAVYIHRIATNPAYRGKNMVLEIVNWAQQFGAAHSKQYIRLDTCGNNTRLIDHYCKCGFHFLGMRKLKNSDGLPAHYADANVCYFEMPVSS